MLFSNERRAMQNDVKYRNKNQLAQLFVLGACWFIYYKYQPKLKDEGEITISAINKSFLFIFVIELAIRLHLYYRVVKDADNFVTWT